jgi:hypothetical protein
LEIEARAIEVSASINVVIGVAGDDVWATPQRRRPADGAGTGLASLECGEMMGAFILRYYNLNDYAIVSSEKCSYQDS